MPGHFPLGLHRGYPHLLLLLCLGFCISPSEPEIFSSVAKMKTLPRLERRLLDRFYDFVRSLPDQKGTSALRGACCFVPRLNTPRVTSQDFIRRNSLHPLRTFVKLWQLQKINAKLLANPSLIESPLNAFRLVKRLVRRWGAIFTSLSDDVMGAKLKVFVNSTKEWLSKQDIWPTSVDVTGAATALVRLHHLYNLPYGPLLEGRFLNVTSSPLTSLELTYVTRAAIKLGFICDAKELFSALEASSARPGAGEQTAARVGRLRDMLATLTIGSTTECETNLRNMSIPSLASLESASVQMRKESVKMLYHQLCRKSMEAPIIPGSSGRWCYWHSTHIPYLKFKAELVNSDPFIVVFHDVISDDEIAEMKDLSFGKLSPSTLAVAEVAHEKQLIRVSQNAWLFDSSPVVKRVSDRVKLITGLSTAIYHHDTHAEPYQVLNYGLGGVYGPHEDSVPSHLRGSQESEVKKILQSGVLKKQKKREYRVAMETRTPQCYGIQLSDVSLGGATVFPLLGASVQPQKGTAAFWYNLKRSGSGDVRMVHAGCPVLLGDKWVANKWLREAGNVFTRPCLLHPNL